MAYVGAATQLGREFAHAQHPHPLAVFFAEQGHGAEIERLLHVHLMHFGLGIAADLRVDQGFDLGQLLVADRSEEHTSELQSLMRISYAVFCLNKKNKENTNYYNINKNQ